MLIDGQQKKTKKSRLTTTSRRTTRREGNSFAPICTILLMITAITTLTFLSFHLQVAITPEFFHKFPVIHSNKYTLIEGKHSDSNNIFNPALEKCTMKFKDKCPINPIVKYWDEVMDCYVSPLRYLNGLSAPSRARKYLIFQPDLGGWNNIRMALEIAILLAKVTGRILVLSPPAVLYLLAMNKKWKDNKSSMEDFFDFDKLRAGLGLETMTMARFLDEAARSGQLRLPLPMDKIENNDTATFLRTPLWDYLESACYTRQWSPGKSFLAFNITSSLAQEPPQPGLPLPVPLLLAMSPSAFPHPNQTIPVSERLEQFRLEPHRKLMWYDLELHNERFLYLPGHEQNRLLTHFYSFFFFARRSEEVRAKRFMRDRLRYHDQLTMTTYPQVFCVASVLIERLIQLDLSPKKYKAGKKVTVEAAGKSKKYTVAHPQYVAFHIRRGDFQQIHTRLPAERIAHLSGPLVPDRNQRIAYIATDETNRSFFEPFFKEYRAVYFLSDLTSTTASGIDDVNQNYVGMIEQVVCANAHTFIGTPLSTFTVDFDFNYFVSPYITRMRGFMNRTISDPSVSSRTRLPASPISRAGIYDRTYYFMESHMHILQRKPRIHFPLWVRDFVDVFQDIDDDAGPD